MSSAHTFASAAVIFPIYCLAGDIYLRHALLLHFHSSFLSSPTTPSKNPGRRGLSILVHKNAALTFPALHKLEQLEKLIEYGASPRATIYLARAAKVHAFMSGRGYVNHKDVKTVGLDVLRHRIIVSY